MSGSNQAAKKLLHTSSVSFCWPWDPTTSRAGRYRDTTCHSENACFPFHGTGVWHFLRLTHLAACCETRRIYLFVFIDVMIFGVILSSLCGFLDYFWWLRLIPTLPPGSAVSKKRARSLKANGVVSPQTISGLWKKSPAKWKTVGWKTEAFKRNWGKEFNNILIYGLAGFYCFPQMLLGGDLSLEIPFHDQLKLCYIRHIAAYHILYQNIHDLHLTTKSTWRPHAKCEEYLYSTTFPSM